MDTLTNCPFCGSSDIDICLRRGRYCAFVFVQCSFCKASSKACRYERNNLSVALDEEDIGVTRAINAWNRRAQDAQPNN